VKHNEKTPDTEPGVRCYTVVVWAYLAPTISFTFSVSGFSSLCSEVLATAFLRRSSSALSLRVSSSKLWSLRV
jgi:hypothetical protein